LNFRETWRLSSKVYKEVTFQSIFSLRAGSGLPQRGKKDVKQLVNSARTSTLISKLVTTVFIGVFGPIVFIPLTVVSSSAAPKELTIVGSVAAFLAVVLFLIAFMGLQVSTSFVSSKVVDILGPLPLSKRDISRIIFMCFIRIFDIPLIVAPVVFLAAYFYVGGSVLGGLVCLIAVGATEILALTLNIGSARFFYSRIAGGGGKSAWQTALRFVFMLVWILPTFAAYVLVNFAGQVVEFIAYLTTSLSSLLQILVVIYPFSYGFLVSYATFPQTNYLTFGLAVVSSIAYLVVTYYCLRWVTRTASTLSAGGIVRGLREAVKDTVIRPQIPWLGIIRKDLRVASRAPSYASLFLLPAMQTVILAISFSSISDVGLNAALGLLTGISMITLLLPPTLLSIEGLASLYTRSLPMKKRTLISAKTLLSTVTYIMSLMVLSLVATYQRRDYSFILTFGVINTFAIAAAIMLELTILTNKFWKEGFAVGNIYSRLSTYILIFIPSFALIVIPIIAAVVTFFMAEGLVLQVFLAAALVEFAAMTAVVAVHEK
jgi:hypothetical protein